ncbi:MAG: hypothetical protein L3J81_06230, partial [Thermoplasmata archaeon]|nr:hypothetical protein [Thermoplasmata archaeon]
GGIGDAVYAAAVFASVRHSLSDSLNQRLRDDFQWRLRGRKLGRHLQWRLRWELGNEFREAMFLRRLFTRLTDRDLDQVVAALQGAELKASIVAFGDIDFPSHVARQLLRQSPSLVRLFPKAVSAWLGGGAALAPDLGPGRRRTAQ